MKANKPNYTILELRQHFIYDAGKGILTWSNHNSNKRKNKVAGRIDSCGYSRVEFKKKVIYAHRIIWALYYGKHPKHFIDHIDGDKTNNRINNLREVSQRENQTNLRCHRNGKLVGAYFDKRVGKWIARIGTGYKETKKTIYLGSYDTELEAHNKYMSTINKGVTI